MWPAGHGTQRRLYELAQLKNSRGALSDEGLAGARSAYVEAAGRFKAFWDTKRPID
jgi:hypothetical protein